jgi:hypothetical protein
VAHATQPTFVNNNGAAAGIGGRHRPVDIMALTVTEAS